LTKKTLGFYASRPDALSALPYVNDVFKKCAFVRTDFPSLLLLFGRELLVYSPLHLLGINAVTLGGDQKASLDPANERFS